MEPRLIMRRMNTRRRSRKIDFPISGWGMRLMHLNRTNLPIRTNSMDSRNTYRKQLLEKMAPTTTIDLPPLSNFMSLIPQSQFSLLFLSDSSLRKFCYIFVFHRGLCVHFYFLKAILVIDVHTFIHSII